MEEKSTNQNGQSNQSSQLGQNNKPTLSWSQPVGSQNNTHTQQPKTTTSTATVSASSTNAQTSSNSWRTAGIILAILGLCILAVWGMIALRGKSEEGLSVTGSSTPENTETISDTSSVKSDTTENTSAISQPSVPSTIASAGALPFTVSSPQAAGMSVAVSGVSVSAPTWLVVYQDINNAPGGVLGAGLFLPGGTSESIPLLRATEAGKTYFVGESLDNGDRTFSLHGETVITDAQGAALLSTFEAK